ncbi:cytochrome c oxidase assembly protein COX18, mitochondrial isoform 1-T2 [Polymixia lowei]
MLCLRAAVVIRPGSLTLHQLHSQKALSRSYALFTCNHKPQHSPDGPACPPPGLHSVFPRTVNVRLASNSCGGGASWYGSIADSAPVHMTEQLLISSQQITGLPWWASIMCTTLALRTIITLPLGAYQMLIIAKVEALQTEVAELARRLRYEVSVRAKERGWTERHCRYQFKKNMRRIVSELYIRDNCHPFKASLLVWVQLPLWVCLSLALRNLSLAVDQSGTALQSELSVGGALWFSDLTLPDPTWIIPVSLGVINLLIIEMFALQRVEVSRFQKYITNFMRGISVLMVPIAATVPSSMALYWLSSSVVGLGHNLLLRSPAVQRVCGLPALRSSSATPYRDIAAAFRDKYFS